VNQQDCFSFLFAGLVAAILPATVSAQAWPQKPLRMIVSAPPGSAPDIIARIVGEKMSQAFGQPVVIDNKPGAGGIVSMNLLRSSPPDGYTFGIPQAAVVTVTPFTYKEATYDIERDFETVATVASTPMLFVTSSESPAKTLGDAIAMAKAKPDQIAIGNPTRASIPHLAAELMAQRTNTKFQQVPFSATPQGIAAVVKGDVMFYVDGTAPLLPLVRSGRLRAVGVAAEKELPGLEGIPLAKDTVPGLNVYGWFMIAAPKGTPPAVVQRLNTEVNNAIKLTDVIAKFREFGTYSTPGSVEDAQRFVKSEKALFGGVIRQAGLKPE
jgi:tripartite-type tricarboxylate transporter receptor subunit TctC